MPVGITPESGSRETPVALPLCAKRRSRREPERRRIMPLIGSSGCGSVTAMIHPKTTVAAKCIFDPKETFTSGLTDDGNADSLVFDILGNHLDRDKVPCAKMRKEQSFTHRYDRLPGVR